MKKLLFIPAACLVFTACSNDKEGKHHHKKEDHKHEHSADWVISGKVKEAILLDGELSARARFISVSTTDGVVTLGGTVVSKEEAHKVIKLVKGIEGVKSVKDHLRIKPKKVKS